MDWDRITSIWRVRYSFFSFAKTHVGFLVEYGYLQFGYDLGSGPAIIHNGHKRVDDGERHSVILKRTGKEGSIEVDNEYIETGSAEGFTNTMNCEGDIYLGKELELISDSSIVNTKIQSII